MQRSSAKLIGEAAFKSEGEFVRVAKVARQLDISRKRVYQMIAEKKFEAIRLGSRQLRIRTASVRDFLEQATEAFEEEAG